MSEQNIRNLRNAMDNASVDAYLIPTYDEFQNEYTPDYNKRLMFATGFSGSNGIGLVTKDKAFLFTDGRYLTQAKKELGDEFEIIDQQKLPEFTLENHIVGYNPYLFTDTQINKFFPNLNLKKLDQDLVIDIWNDRPKRLNSEVYIYDENYAGFSASKKLEIIRQKIGDKILFVTDPTSVSWALNLRASDVEFCPILLARLILSKDKAMLFGKFDNISEEIRSQMPFIEFLDESELESSLANLEQEVIVDEKTVSQGFKHFITRPIFSKNIIMDMQVIKSNEEIENFKKVHVKDAVALCETLAWIEDAHSQQKDFSEYDIGLKLIEFRSKQQGYVMESFPAIAGYKDNGAVIHYRAQKDTANKIVGEGVLLVDSGGHYFGGTTDITRSIYLGKNPSDEIKRRYTQVLKGHLAIITKEFKKGESGVEIEKSARKALQEDGLNYPHGTGHGVGNFLSVHEGSFLSPRGSEIKENMVISNEPGFYKEGEYGIRIENLVYATKKSQDILGFEDLTLVPYCHSLIEFTLLNPPEIEHIKAYHDKIRRVIGPFLSDRAKKWLNDQ